MPKSPHSCPEPANAILLQEVGAIAARTWADESLACPFARHPVGGGTSHLPEPVPGSVKVQAGVWMHYRTEELDRQQIT